MSQTQTESKPPAADVYRGSGAALGAAVGQAAPGSHPHAVRLARDRPLLAVNPAAPVRGPKYTVMKGKTPVLTAEETRALLDSIDTRTVIGMRDCALIGLMVYSFARVSAALQMEVQDVYVQAHRS